MKNPNIVINKYNMYNMIGLVDLDERGRLTVSL